MTKYILMVLTTILIFFTACTEKVDRQEQNKDLVLRANQELLNMGNIAYVDSVFAEDYRNNGSEVKREAIKNFASSLLEAFPDLQVTIQPIVAEGDLVGWRRTHTGTHQGQIMGYPATNKTITWHSTIITRIVDGKIIEEWGSGTSLHEQLEASASGEN